MAPGVVVGTQPRSPTDVDRLVAEARVTCIMNTQQDADMVHWGVDAAALARRCADRNVLLVRYPFPDFSADGLRAGLPAAVAALDALLRAGHTVYLHCTAGMGRSPGVAIAHAYWCSHAATLDEAYAALTAVRPCGPNKEAIRGATSDLLSARLQPGQLPPPDRELRAWPAGQGATLTSEERARLQGALRAAAPQFARLNGAA